MCIRGCNRRQEEERIHISRKEKHMQGHWRTLTWFCPPHCCEPWGAASTLPTSHTTSHGAQNWEGATRFGVTPYLHVSHSPYPMQKKLRTSPRWGSAPMLKKTHHSQDNSTYYYHDFKMGCPKPHLLPKLPNFRAL